MHLEVRHTFLHAAEDVAETPQRRSLSVPAREVSPQHVARLCDAPRQVTPAFASDEPVIIFDWDDTLFPTSALRMSKPTSQLMQTHAQLLRQVLCIARSIARVAVVTLSERGWVSRSAELYLPGLDMEQLLNDLDIEIYYAREFLQNGNLMEIRYEMWQVDLAPTNDKFWGLDWHWECTCFVIDAVMSNGLVAEWNASHPTAVVRPGDMIVAVEPLSPNSSSWPSWCKMTLARGLEDYVTPRARAKCEAMSRCIDTLCCHSSRKRNVMSIGDALADCVALNMAMQTRPHDLCKTVKFQERPSVEQLGHQLRVLLAWLPRLTKLETHLEHIIEELEM